MYMYVVYTYMHKHAQSWFNLSRKLLFFFCNMPNCSCCTQSILICMHIIYTFSKMFIAHSENARWLHQAKYFCIRLTWVIRCLAQNGSPYIHNVVWCIHTADLYSLCAPKQQRERDVLSARLQLFLFALSVLQQNKIKTMKNTWVHTHTHTHTGKEQTSAR